MDSVNMEQLAIRIKEHRGAIGIRKAAAEVGISAATLSRVENGKIPDLETFSKICQWLDDDPSIYLGLQPRSASVPTALVHFKKESAIRPESAQALGEMILAAQRALLAEELAG